jgi:hypothetical protein
VVRFFLALLLLLLAARVRVISSTLLFLLMLSAHLGMTRFHLGIVSTHLSVPRHLLIHGMLAVSRTCVLGCFVMRVGLVSLTVVIVTVKIFSLVFVPVVLGPKLLAMFFTAAHSCSLAAMFSDVSRLILSFSRSRSRTLKVMFIFVTRFVSSSRCCCSPCGLESLRAFALASAFVFVE